MRATLVKWDASVVGENPPNDIDPTTHPGCIEVIELQEGQTPVTVYRRQENGTDNGG